MNKTRGKILSIIMIALFLPGCDIGSGSDTAQNQKPTADAGSGQIVGINETLQLDGSGSNDADSDTLSFTWSIKEAPPSSTTTLSDALIVNPTFTPDRDGDYTIGLIVNDGIENSSAVELTITANGFIGIFGRTWVENGETNGMIPNGTDCKETLYQFIGDGTPVDSDNDGTTDFTTVYNALYIISTVYTVSNGVDTIVWQFIIEDDTPEDLSDSTLHQVLMSGIWADSGDMYDAVLSALSGTTNTLSLDYNSLTQTSAGGSTVNSFTRE